MISCNIRKIHRNAKLSVGNELAKPLLKNVVQKVLFREIASFIIKSVAQLATILSFGTFPHIKSLAYQWLLGLSNITNMRWSVAKALLCTETPFMPLH